MNYKICTKKYNIHPITCVHSSCSNKKIHATTNINNEMQKQKLQDKETVPVEREAPTESKRTKYRQARTQNAAGAVASQRRRTRMGVSWIRAQTPTSHQRHACAHGSRILQQQWKMPLRHNEGRPAGKVRQNTKKNQNEHMRHTARRVS